MILLMKFLLLTLQAIQMLVPKNLHSILLALSSTAYSAFGSYTETKVPIDHLFILDLNLLLDGKCVDYSTTTTSWQIWDSARSKTNVANDVLYANGS